MDTETKCCRWFIKGVEIMPSSLEIEMKQSVMLRAASLDIKRDYEDIIYKLYDESYKGDGDYKTTSAEWAMIISDFFTRKDIPSYTSIVIKSVEKEINLWEWGKWTTLMKVQLPIQYRDRMTEFTQVPKLASMGTPPKKQKVAEWPDWSE